MKLFICDDNRQFAQKLKADILKLEPDTDITLFYTISSLMFALEDKGNTVDGIIMDVENTDGNGIEASEKIRQQFPLIKLVFATGYGDEYSQDIFNCPTGSEPVAFLLKPVKEKYLRLALDKICNKSASDERYIQIVYNRTTVFINENEIIYISSDKRKLTVHTVKESHTCYQRLEELLSKLSGKFCRCHKSFIINMDYIKAVENWSCAVLKDGTGISVGKAYLDNFRKGLIAYKASEQREER